MNDFDLSDPAQAREFLKSIRVKGKGRITFLETASGEKVSIDDASDEQILQLVKDLKLLNTNDC